MAIAKPPRLPGYTLGDRVADGKNLAWWPAVDRKGNEVALRIVALPSSMQDSARTRLERWRSLPHSHLMRIVDVPHASDGGLAVITERLPGADLAAHVRSRGPLDPAQAEALVADISGALEALHSGGIVHADVSPRNLLFTTRGWVLVDGTDPITLRGGTPGFVGPERAASGAATAAGDVYALAATAAWALASDPGRKDRRAVYSQGIEPDLDGELIALLDAASSINPSARPHIHSIHAAATSAVTTRVSCQDIAASRWQHLEPEDLALGNLRAMALSAPTRMVRTGRRRFGRGEGLGSRSNRGPTWRSACLLGVLTGLTLTGAGLPEPTAASDRPSTQVVAGAGAEHSSPHDLNSSQEVAAARTLLRQRDLALAGGDQRLLVSLTAPGSPARARDQRLRIALGQTRLVGFSTWTYAVLEPTGVHAVMVSQREHIRVGSQGVQIVPTQATQCVVPRLVQDHRGQVRIAAMEPC